MGSTSNLTRRRSVKRQAELDRGHLCDVSRHRSQVCQDIVPSLRSSCDRAWSSREGSRVNDRKSSPSSVITRTPNPSTRTSISVPISPRPIPMWCRRESCRRVTTGDVDLVPTKPEPPWNREGLVRGLSFGSRGECLGRSARCALVAFPARVSGRRGGGSGPRIERGSEGSTRVQSGIPRRVRPSESYDIRCASKNETIRLRASAADGSW